MEHQKLLLPPCALLPVSNTPLSQAATLLSLYSSQFRPIFLSLQYMTRNVWHLCFCVWLISVTMLSSSPIHFSANNRILIFYGWILFHFVCYIFFIHSSGDEHLDSFHVLVIVNMLYKHGGSGISWYNDFTFIGYILSTELQFHFKFFKKSPYYFL